MDILSTKFIKMKAKNTPDCLALNLPFSAYFRAKIPIKNTPTVYNLDSICPIKATHFLGKSQH